MDGIGNLLAVKIIKVANDQYYKGKVDYVERMVYKIAQLQQGNQFIMQYFDQAFEPSYDSSDSESDVAHSPLKHLNIYMKYVPGGSVKTLLDNYGGFHENVIKMYLVQLLNALQECHNFKIFHRDIKCSNLLVDDSGMIQLSDFGFIKLAQVTDEDFEQAFCALPGSEIYTPPEILREQEIYESSDTWQVGLTALEMFTGIAPYSEMDVQSVIRKLTLGRKTNQVIPLLPESCSEQFLSFLNACFILDPLKRPSVAELSKHEYVLSKFFVIPSRHE